VTNSVTDTVTVKYNITGHGLQKQGMYEQVGTRYYSMPLILIVLFSCLFVSGIVAKLCCQDSATFPLEQ